MQVADWLCKWAVRKPILFPLTVPLMVGSASHSLHWHRAIAVWRQVWQSETSVGLAQGCSHHRELSSLILHKLHIKSLQHLFFFPRLTQPKQGRWLIWKRDEISLSLCCPLGVTSSHDHDCGAKKLNAHVKPISCCTQDIWHTGTRHTQRPRTRMRCWYFWKRIKRESGGMVIYFHKKKEDRGHMCLWKRKNAALKITSREIIYHYSLYHFFWQRQMAWSQIGSLLAFFEIFCLLCVLSTHTHTHTHTPAYTQTLSFTFTRTNKGGEWQLAMSAKWTSAFNNELTPSSHMIIVKAELNNMNSCKVVNLSSNRL